MWIEKGPRARRRGNEYLTLQVPQLAFKRVNKTGVEIVKQCSVLDLGA
jgi:hypothetical protein